VSTRQKLLDRLAKLLALSQSSNSNEAASAREKADKIMADHGISASEVERNEQGLFEVSLGHEGFNATWKFSLATAAARFHGCEAVGLKKRRQLHVRIVGSQKGEVDQAEALFREMIEKMSSFERFAAGEIEEIDDVESEFGVPVRQCVDSFRRGVAYGLIWKLAMARPDRFGLRRPSESPTSSGEDSGFANDVPNQPIVTSENPTTESALVRLVDTEKADQSERVKSKYKPTTKPLDLDEVTSWWWYDYGRRLVDDLISVSGQDDSEDFVVADEDDYEDEYDEDFQDHFEEDEEGFEEGKETVVKSDGDAATESPGEKPGNAKNGD
jgi:hypothetical protein